MPVRKVAGGYKWGKTGKVYKTRAGAERQAKAAYASGYKPKKMGMSKGGSTVNAAGNYTKPGMRKALVAKVKAGGKGGKPGQWSARKAQMVAKQYKAKGGGYK
jgi:hypothetical protein